MNFRHLFSWFNLGGFNETRTRTQSPSYIKKSCASRNVGLNLFFVVAMDISIGRGALAEPWMHLSVPHERFARSVYCTVCFLLMGFKRVQQLGYRYNLLQIYNVFLFFPNIWLIFCLSVNKSLTDFSGDVIQF